MLLGPRFPSGEDLSLLGLVESRLHFLQLRLLLLRHRLDIFRVKGILAPDVEDCGQLHLHKRFLDRLQLLLLGCFALGLCLCIVLWCLFVFFFWSLLVLFFCELLFLFLLHFLIWLTLFLFLDLLGCSCFFLVGGVTSVEYTSEVSRFGAVWDLADQTK